MDGFDFSQFDGAGRVHKKAFIVSHIFLCYNSRLTNLKVATSTLLAICVLSTIARFYIRLFLQHQFSIDDFFLIFGVGCISCAIGTVYVVLDGLYLGMAMTSGDPSILSKIPPNWLEITYHYHKMVTISGILTWAAIVCVKMSFIFFFKKLIDRIRFMVIYWRITLAFNIVTSLYGFSTLIVACPYFNTLKICEFSAHLYSVI